MTLDGILLRAVVTEWRQELIGARVDRVNQLNRHLIVLDLYYGQRSSLVLSFHPSILAGCLGQLHLPKPAVPTSFCMLLRKHLMGARLSNVEQHGCDRVAFLSFERFDELGDRSHLHLVSEWLGTQANLYLIDDRQTILGSLLRPAGPDDGPAPPDGSEKRMLNPGFRYIPPLLPENRPTLCDSDEHTLRAALLDAPAVDARGPAWRWLMGKGSGLGPALSRDLFVRSGLDPESSAAELTRHERTKLAEWLLPLAADVRSARFRPSSIPARGVYAAFPLHSFSQDEQITYPTANQLLIDVLRRQWQDRQMAAQRHRLLQFARRQEKHAAKKIEARRQEWNTSEEAERWRLYGELITANLYRIRRGERQLEAVNYYEPEQPVLTIPLDPLLSPSDNAQLYFTRHKKALRRRELLASLLEESKAEHEYWQTVLNEIEQAEAVDDLVAIEEELLSQGYRVERGEPGKQRTGNGRSHHQRSSIPARTYSLADDWVLYVGRNNVQNDELTMRQARKNDLWLHAKEIPGSHAILRAVNSSPQTFSIPPQEILVAAAQIAAYYSKARFSSNVPVDYTWRKHVRKPKGAKPGMVIYDHHQTVYVTPALPVSETV